MPETITQDGEVVADEPTALAILQSPNQSLVATMLRAEIDTLVTTARTYPRSIDRAVKMLKSIVTLDATSALECIFALPRGGKPIRGASIRFAEAALASWGNAMVQASVTHIDREEKVVIAEGSYRDLETNVMTRSSVRRRISDKNGRLFTDDLIIVTGNAACSIARRNAILAGIPKPVWRAAYEAVEATIAGNAQTLSATRDSAVKAFAMYGVKPEQVFAALGVTGIEDVQLDHVITLRGMYSAIKNEEATVEEVFNMRVTAAKSEGVADPLGPAAPAAPASAPAAGAKPAKEPAKPKKAKEPGEGQPPGQAPAAAAEGVADHQAPAAAATETAKAPAEPAGGDQAGEAQPAAPAAEAKPAAAPAAPKAPANEAEYEAHVLAYISAATSSGALADQWKGDRGLRQAVNITSETMDKLKAAVTAKIDALKAEGK